MTLNKLERLISDNSDKAPLKQIGSTVVKFTTKTILPLFRVSLGIVYIWFGILKILRASPVVDLIAKTTLPAQERVFYGLAGLLELVVGIGLLFRVTLRLMLFLFFFELANTLLMAKESKSLLKNLLLFIAGLALAGTTKRGDEKSPSSEEETKQSSRVSSRIEAQMRQASSEKQIFPRQANLIARASIFGIIFLLAGVALLAYFYVRSSYATGVDVATGQLIPFSHHHHVGELDLDCRYCHSSVMVSSSAGMPSTKTCMTCHSQIWSDSIWLIPVYTSWLLDAPIEWNRVYDLPDFTYFDHSVHVAKGVGCETCHGRVDQMPVTWKAESLQMIWCLDCHSEPSRFLRPSEEVLTMGYQPQEDQLLLGTELVQEYQVPVGRLTDCYVCHR